MLKLIKLELKRNRINGYISAAHVITIAMIGLTYLFAAIPRLEDTDTDIEMFMTYNGISRFVFVVSMVCFSILSSVMYNRFIIEEYTGKKAVLLFSYPVNRNRVLWAKVTTVFLFTTISMIFSGLITFSIFFVTESFIPLCKDTLTVSTIFRTISYLICYSLISAALAVISLWFGYWKKSASTTIVSGIIVLTASGNFLAVGISNALIAVIVASVTIILALILIMSISHKISTMEV